MRIVSEAEFKERIEGLLLGEDGNIATTFKFVGSVTGHGRSGAIAAVYASHILGAPFVPYKTEAVPTHLGILLIIDTAMESGATMRKAERFYKHVDSMSRVCYHEPPRVAFWYEAQKPQRYKHELRTETPIHQ